jgi:hypothetical protein
MRAKIIYIFSLYLLCLLLIFYLVKQPAILNCQKRKSSNLKLKKGKQNNFKVREKLNEHPDKKGVITTSLFGDSKHYTEPILNERIYRPEKWYIRIYLCPTLLDKYKEEFLKRDFEIFVMESPSEGLSGTIWRFLPLEDGTKFISLDADDFEDTKKLFAIVPNKKLFDKWEANPKPFLFFAVSFCSPIMAGKWGAHYKFNNLSTLLEKYDFTERGADEILLRTHIYPLALKHGFLRLSKHIASLIPSSLFEGYNSTESF